MNHHANKAGASLIALIIPTMTPDRSLRSRTADFHTTAAKGMKNALTLPENMVMDIDGISRIAMVSGQNDRRVTSQTQKSSEAIRPDAHQRYIGVSPGSRASGRHRTA